MATRAFTRNAPYIKQQFYALLGNTSPTVKFICIVTICGYIISYSDLAITVLSVTPGYLLPPAFWIWTAFTFCFLEIHFWEVLMDIITVGLCGKLIEPLWGQMQMLTFFAIVNIGVAVLSSLYYLFLYVCTKNTEILFDVHIHGLAGYVAAVSVAVRQIMPDLLIVKTPIGKLTNRNIPLTVLFLSIILWICGLLDGTFPVMFTSGLLVSWIYLRFYQRHTNSNRGDASENFTFASFFPNVMQPMVSILVHPIYTCCVRVGVIKSLVARSVSSASLTSVSSSVTIPNVDFHDMERRRQIALKALSERLSKTTDLNRQNNNTSKSFPQAVKQHHHHHQHQHHHQQHPMLTSFTIPAIPLPPPPTTTTTTTQSSSNASHIVPTNTIATTSDNTSSNTLINIEQDPPIS